MIPQVRSGHDVSDRSFQAVAGGLASQYLADFREMCELLHTSPQEIVISSRSLTFRAGPLGRVGSGGGSLPKVIVSHAFLGWRQVPISKYLPVEEQGATGDADDRDAR